MSNRTLYYLEPTAAKCSLNHLWSFPLDVEDPLDAHRCLVCGRKLTLIKRGIHLGYRKEISK